MKIVVIGSTGLIVDNVSAAHGPRPDPRSASRRRGPQWYWDGL